MTEHERLRQEAIGFLSRYDAIQMEAAKLRQALDKACADYGRATSRWGFAPQHLRDELRQEGRAGV